MCSTWAITTMAGGPTRCRRLPDRDSSEGQHAAFGGGRQSPAGGSLVLSDRIGHLPARQARSRINPFQDPVRELHLRTETGKILRIVTNDLDAPADEIAELYKRRWQIELFFRWIKHTLKIRHFFGTSENAVRIQIAIALIAFLLLRAAHALQNSVPACSPSPGSSSPTSCIDARSIACLILRHHAS